MARRQFSLMLFVARIGHPMTIPETSRFAKAIGVPKGWAIQKLENIYSRTTGKLSLRWVSLYEIEEPHNWVFGTLPTWEAAGRLAVAKIWPPPQP